MATLSYFPDAIATPIGQAHPITGEQLNAVTGLADAIGFYKPNANSHSFLEVDGVESEILRSVVQGQKATLAVLSLKEIESVSWNFGDGTDVVEGIYIIAHGYPVSNVENIYTVSAAVTYKDESTASVTADIVIPAVVSAS